VSGTVSVEPVGVGVAAGGGTAFGVPGGGPAPGGGPLPGELAPGAGPTAADGDGPGETAPKAFPGGTETSMGEGETTAGGGKAGDGPAVGGGPALVGGPGTAGSGGGGGGGTFDWPKALPLPLPPLSPNALPLPLPPALGAAFGGGPAQDGGLAWAGVKVAAVPTSRAATAQAQRSFARPPAHVSPRQSDAQRTTALPLPLKR